MTSVARFYKDVDVGEEASGFVVRLDGKPIKTPGRVLLSLRNRALAEAVATEWCAQQGTLDPATMPLTRLAYAVLDAASLHRARLIEEILAYGQTDLLCYRADEPATLAARQAAAWNPLLDWASETHSARLAVGTGIAFIAQSAAARAALAKAVTAQDDYALVVLHAAASITGSLVLALALVSGRLDAAEAFASSCLDEKFQNEAWGRDAEAEARVARLGQELAAAERFMRLAAARP